MEDEICDALTADLGKTKFVAYLSEVKAVQEAAKHDAEHIDEWAKTIDVDTPIFCAPGASKIMPEPLGIVLVMSAWNYPVNLLLHPAV